jgi:hypothetical protein
MADTRDSPLVREEARHAGSQVRTDRRRCSGDRRSRSRRRRRRSGVGPAPTQAPHPRHNAAHSAIGPAGSTAGPVGGTICSGSGKGSPQPLPLMWPSSQQTEPPLTCSTAPLSKPAAATTASAFVRVPTLGITQRSSLTRTGTTSKRSSMRTASYQPYDAACASVRESLELGGCVARPVRPGVLSLLLSNRVVQEDVLPLVAGESVTLFEEAPKRRRSH